MKQYNVSLVVEVPERGATEDQIEEWIKFTTGICNTMSGDNPLSEDDIKSNWIEIESH